MNIFDVMRNTIHDLTHEKVRVWRINRRKAKDEKAAEMSDAPTSFRLTKRRVKALEVWTDKLGELPLFLSDDPDVLAQEIGVILTSLHIRDSIGYDHMYHSEYSADCEIKRMDKRRELRIRLLKTLANSLADIEQAGAVLPAIPQERENL